MQVNGWRQAASPENSADWDVVNVPGASSGRSKVWWSTPTLGVGRWGVRASCCYACRLCTVHAAHPRADQSVHFLRGEHHDRWNCQSAVVKSCLPGVSHVFGRDEPRRVRSRESVVDGTVVLRYCCVLSCMPHLNALLGVL